MRKGWLPRCTDRRWSRPADVVFRNEAALSPGIRQLEFDMREIVLLGPHVWVEETAQQGQRQLECLARSLGLEGDWVVAEDPFFLPAACTGQGVLATLARSRPKWNIKVTLRGARPGQRQSPRDFLWRTRFGITDAHRAAGPHRLSGGSEWICWLANGVNLLLPRSTMSLRPCS